MKGAHNRRITRNVKETLARLQGEELPWKFGRKIRRLPDARLDEIPKSRTPNA